MRAFISSYAVFLLMLFSGTLAVSAAATSDPPADRERIIQALDALKQKGDVLFEGEISVSAPKEGDDDIGIIQLGIDSLNAEGSDPYIGAFRLWLNRNGQYVLASNRPLPRVFVYIGGEGEDPIIQSRYHISPVGAGSLSSVLPKLTRPDELRRFVTRAASVSPVEGAASTYRFEIPKRTIPDAVEGLLEVHQIYGEITLTENGAIASIRFSVICRNQFPTISAGRLALSLFFGKLASFSDLGLSTEEPAESTTTYMLKFAGHEPSPELKAFREAARSEIAEE